jgi:hypothetical protein
MGIVLEPELRVIEKDQTVNVIGIAGDQSFAGVIQVDIEDQALPNGGVGFLGMNRHNEKSGYKNQ